MPSDNHRGAPPGALAPDQKNDNLDLNTRLAVQRTNLASERTLLAHERTLMAWVRTATAMITFGFTIFNFFQNLRNENVPQRHWLTPRGLALVLIGIGTVALVLATWRYGREVVHRAAAPGKKGASLTMLAAMVIVLFGAAAFFQVAAATR